MKNHLGEQVYSSYGAWKHAARHCFPGCTFEGSKDIASAIALVTEMGEIVGRKSIGEWNGESGVLYNVNAS